MPAPRTLRAAALLLVWTGYLTALQWSVVRFELAIVLVVTSAAVLLTTALVRRWPAPDLPDRVLAVTALVCALVAERVPFFSYVDEAGRRGLAHAVALTAVLAAVLLATGRPWARAGAAVVAAAGLVVTGAAVIVLDPAPRIDVWVTLQQASDGLARGQNMYAMVWVNSPGVKDAFTYLPWTAVLLAPGRWLVGDVRWALLVLQVVALGAVAGLGAVRTGGRRRVSAAALGAVLLIALAPGTITQSEQAWTEPMLFAAIAGWALLLRRGHPWWAVLPLALGCASKQHLALLLPVLACWAPFGPRRTVATAGLAGLLVLPWFLASPADLWHDTVTLLVGFHPIRFANTLFLASLNELGRTPPFWLTGAIVLGVLLGACRAVHRRRPGLSELVGWLALVLLVANLVNKQAFYNQYWLVAALVALALAAAPAHADDGADDADADDAASSTGRDSTAPGTTAAGTTAAGTTAAGTTAAGTTAAGTTAAQGQPISRGTG